VRIDGALRVVGRSGQPIRGLWAAGSAGQGGVLLNGHGHHLGWAFTSGRLAGRNAALAPLLA
jgi:fumarate reductase flavoprotein subunit